MKDKKLFFQYSKHGINFFCNFHFNRNNSNFLGIDIAQEQIFTPSDPQYATVQLMYDLAYPKTHEIKMIRAQEYCFFLILPFKWIQKQFNGWNKNLIIQVAVQNIQFKCLTTSIPI
ncbi:unnamed protein product [Paramecium pentaurelia]|uniref:Uncharacterized protein n=1 Tax=Paramecium pentaurelia TaxID=43138 RepID=A0A8S1YIV9_9CILI|nr:unnamed protein product [Paramecium pentaurelia]CAD8213343.1 unnamed protein product [Paramecium pentaurelia]